MPSNPQAVRHRRSDARVGHVAMALTVLLLPVAYVLATSSSPAVADRLDFLCSPKVPAQPGSTTTTTPVLTDTAVKIFDGLEYTFTGHAPPGVKVKGVAPDPVTGWTTFVQKIPFRFGWVGVDFLDPADVPGSDGSEIDFQFMSRLATNAGVPTRLTELFTQNFGAALDFGLLRDNISMAGVDLNVAAHPVMKDMPFKFEISLGLEFKLSNKDKSETRVGVAFDATQPGTQIPHSLLMGIALKHDVTTAPVDYVAVHHYIQSWDVNPATANQPGLAIGVNVESFDVVNSVPTNFKNLFNARESWTHAPQQLALGARSLCNIWDANFNSTAQFGWNMAGLFDPSSTTFGVDFEVGQGDGLPVRFSGPPGTSPDRAAREALHATVEKVPQQFDAIIHPDSVGITRSLGVAPTITVRALDLATDDKTKTGELPTHVEGQIVDLPRHVHMTAGFGPDGGGINRTDISMWNLTCPGEPTPPGIPAPADVRRNDVKDTLPIYPAGCTRYSLAPATVATAIMQNFLPQDLNAVDAMAGLAAPPDTNQFVYRATRSTNPLSPIALYRMGGRLRGLTRVAYDGSVPGSVKFYAQRVEPASGDDSADVVLDIDGRTNLTDAVASTGRRIQAAAKVVDLPGAIRGDYDTSTARPAHVAWRASAGIAIADGHIDVQGAGPTVNHAIVDFETGSVGAGALPPAGDLSVSEPTPQPTDGQTTVYAWQAPTALPAGDTFPTPVVPNYDPDAISRVHAGAVITDEATDEAGTEMRVHADLQVPQTVSIVTSRVPGKGATSATLCNPSKPSCASTRLDVTAAYGAIADRSNLLVAPAMPVVPADTAAAVSPFAPFRPGSGARAIRLADGTWGIDGVVTGVAGFSEATNPTDLTLLMAAAGPQPFHVNALDASGTSTDAAGQARPQVLFVDAALDRLPSQMRVVVRDDSTPDGQPWIWVNTENVTLTDIGQIDTSAVDPPGTRPVLTGVARIGDRLTLAQDLNYHLRPTGLGPRVRNGADVWGDFDLNGGHNAVDVSVRLDVPRHVLMWRPDTSKCSDKRFDADTCQQNPLYEMDEVTQVAIKAVTTAATLGDLNGLARLRSGTADYFLQPRLATVPGQLAATVTLAQNRRLPWTSLDLGIAGSQAVGAVTFDAYDNGMFPACGTGEMTPKQVRYRNGSNGALGAVTPTYSVELAHVSTTMDLHARIKGSESRLDTSVPDPTKSNCGRLGYLHALLDLQPDPASPAATTINMDVTTLPGQLAAVIDPDQKISGLVNARLDHVFVDDGAGDSKSAFGEYMQGGGLLGNLTKQVFGNILWAALPITYFIDLVIGLILEIIGFGGDGGLHTVLDFDLPIFAEFDQVCGIRFGDHAQTLSVDASKCGSDSDMKVGVGQRPLPHENAGPDAVTEGAWYYKQATHYFWTGKEDWDFNESLSNQFNDVGMYDWHLCADTDTTDPVSGPSCGSSPRSRDNVVDIDDYATSGRPGGWTSADILLDPVFPPDMRVKMENQDDGTAHTAREAYSGLANQAAPFLDADFAVPELSPTVPVTGTEELTTRMLIGQGTGFIVLCPDDDDFSNGSVSNDGTQYSVSPLCFPLNNGLFQDRVFGFVLKARYGNGVGRWLVRLPNPVGYQEDDEGNLVTGGDHSCELVGRCKVAITLAPQFDGSLQITMTTSKQDPDTLLYEQIGTVRAWVDASGHPGWDKSTATAVPDFSATNAFINSSGNATLDPAAAGAGPYGCAGFICPSYQWVFGDGTKSDIVRMTPSTNTPPAVTHHYPRVRGTSLGVPQHLAMLVVYSPIDGEVMQTKYFRVRGDNHIGP